MTRYGRMPRHCAAPRSTICIVARGARMVPFAGYEMPVQYPAGIIAEHLHTRAKAGLFDVSHMGQVRLRGAAAARALEALVPGRLRGRWHRGRHALHAVAQRQRAASSTI